MKSCLLTPRGRLDALSGTATPIDDMELERTFIAALSVPIEPLKEFELHIPTNRRCLHGLDPWSRRSVKAKVPPRIS